MNKILMMIAKERESFKKSVKLYGEAHIIIAQSISNNSIFSHNRVQKQAVKPVQTAK